MYLNHISQSFIFFLTFVLHGVILSAIVKCDEGDLSVILGISESWWSDFANNAKITYGVNQYDND